MGGVKKKSMASMEKSQDSDETAQQSGAATKGKKGKEQKAAPQQQQKRLPFLPPKMSEQEMLKSLTPLKAITVYTASRALGVNASIATGILREMETKNLVRKAGGFSGHTVWAMASA
ncbi:MAG: 40S ribosomal protein S25 [Thaumarchaeota archaeon]|nr:40S ribosomal protein S25 [Nitrososphaerota archaeon]